LGGVFDVIERGGLREVGWWVGKGAGCNSVGALVCLLVGLDVGSGVGDKVREDVMGGGVITLGAVKDTGATWDEV